MTDNGQDRHNCHSLHRPMLHYVERHLGREGLARLAERAGDPRSLDVILDTTQWCSWDQTRRLLEAAAEILGAPDTITDAAAFFDRATVPESAEETMAALQSLGGPAGILRAIGEAASKFSSAIIMAPEAVDEHGGVVVARSVPGFPRYPMLCMATAGLLRMSAQVFGLRPAEVSEDRCETRGDPECRFRVVWQASVRDRPGTGDRTRQGDLDALRARFNSLRSTVAELVSGHDVETVLERIVEQASRAARAPRYLLAARITELEPVRIHAIGFDPVAAEALAHSIAEDGAPSEDGSRLVVDVRSPRRHYGRLLACNPDGVCFLPEERLNLTAYAELAAAALESAAALEDARRHAETATTLLELAGALSEVTSTTEVATRLAAAVPAVVGATSAAVLVWDGHELATAASYGLSDALAAELARYRTPLGADAPLRIAIDRGEPYLVATEEVNGRLRGVLEQSGTTAVAVVPIRVADRLFGIVSAGVSTDVHRLRHDGHFVNRLAGLASIAATAFQNASLLEQIRYQSLHDHLTGTPNVRLLEDRVDQALSAGRRSGRATGLLFVDLDHFKDVNDRYGHAIGDDVLRHVALRLATAVREVDTVARLGGDEFVVVLAGIRSVDDAEAVRRKILDALGPPVPTCDGDVQVGASVGIAVAPRDGEDIATLLRAADAAMYATKAAAGAQPM